MCLAIMFVIETNWDKVEGRWSEGLCRDGAFTSRKGQGFKTLSISVICLQTNDTLDKNSGRNQTELNIALCFHFGEN